MGLFGRSVHNLAVDQGCTDLVYDGRNPDGMLLADVYRDKDGSDF